MIWDHDIKELPGPGCFKLRLVRGGPWLPAVVYMPCPIDPHFGYPLDRPRRLIAEVAGRPADPLDVWTMGAPIPLWEYEWMRDDNLYQRAYDPSAPEARPTKRIDPTTMQPILP